MFTFQSPGSFPSSGCLVVKTGNVEFDILRSGYVRARLRSSSGWLTLDDADSRGSVALLVNERKIQDFRPVDCTHAQIDGATARLGAAGKRIEIRARSASLPALEETIVYEVYDDFPDVLLTTVAWRNASSTDLSIRIAAVQRQRLSAAQSSQGVLPYQMWSFQGSSEEWGKDDIVPLSSNFSRVNPMQQLTFSPKGAGGAGGGIPVVAFWTEQVGEAMRV